MVVLSANTNNSGYMHRTLTNPNVQYSTQSVLCQAIEYIRYLLTKDRTYEYASLY